MLANWTEEDIEGAFLADSKWGSSKRKIISYIQIAIIIFNIYSFTKISYDCRGVGEFCGLGIFIVLVPSIIIILILSAVKSFYKNNSTNSVRKNVITTAKSLKILLYIIMFPVAVYFFMKLLIYLGF